MVRLHIKRGDESLFLFETTVTVQLADLIPQLAKLQNDRLRIDRLAMGGWGVRAGPCAFGKAYLGWTGLTCSHPLICLTSFAEVEMLADHGIMKPPDMQGLTDEQVRGAGRPLVCLTRRVPLNWPLNLFESYAIPIGPRAEACG